MPAFDLGDSRDLAAAVRAAWDQKGTEEQGSEGSPRVEVPRPPLDRRTGAVAAPAADIDPLAHLRSGTPKRFAIGVPRRPFAATGKPRAKHLAAGFAMLAAVSAAAAVPMVSGATKRSPEVAEPRRTPSTTTTWRAVAPTTAFTYPPETIVPPDTTAPPTAPTAAAPPATSGSATRATAAPTRSPTTSRPRSTSTTRSTPKTTRAPAPATTQPPPPPPDDGGDSDGSGDSSEPPPYP